MPAWHRASLTLLAVLTLTGLLTACAGGPVARQIVRSLATQAADKITSDYVDARLLEDTEPAELVLATSYPDEDQIAFLVAGLPSIPAPASSPVQLAADTSTLPAPAARISKLVPVEIRHFITGSDKEAILAQYSAGQLAGAIPPRGDWSAWGLAEGGAQDAQRTPMRFLIPPDFETLHGGDVAVVEIDVAGGLAIARHKL